MERVPIPKPWYLDSCAYIVFDAIPHNPVSTVYQQGNALGGTYAHWRRAKFYQQFRLYFRYDLASKVIIYAWVNGEATERAYGSKTDAYAVFAGMLGTGNPPDSWAMLLKEREAEEARRATAGEPTINDPIADARKV